MAGPDIDGTYGEYVDHDRNQKPEIQTEPVAWMDATGDFYVQDLRRRSVAGPRAREVFSTNGAALENYTALYAHPPVTAEPATAPSECDDHRDTFSCYEYDGQRYIAHNGSQWVTATSVDTSDATVSAPSVDLVEGLNVEEWADKAEKRGGKIEALNAVLSDAADALVAHGFTRVALESQTLGESIHVLAGRVAPSVEQIADLLVRHQRIPMYETSGDRRQRCVGCDSLKGESDGPNSPRHAQHLAEEIHALYGTPGDAGEDDVTGAVHDRVLAELERAKGYVERAEERAEKAEARLESVESEADAAHTIANRLRAEVERYKAALHLLVEAAKERHDAWMETQDATDVLEQALQRRNAAEDAFALAARAAVEAETSEEAP